MENQKSSSKSIMLNYGLVLGFVSILISVANFAIGNVYEPHWSVSVLGALVTIVAIVYGLKAFKAGNEGFMSLGQSLKIGMGIVLVSTILFLLYFVVFTSYIEPEFYTRSLEVKEQAVIEMYPNLTDEQLESAMDMQKKLNTPVFTTAIVLIMSLFFGFIITLITGLIMKKSRPEE